MRFGVRCSKIISDTYYDKTYCQNQILGRALLESVLLLDGKIIFSAVRQREMEFYGVKPSDLDGIVQVLMGTAGVEAAIFLYETAPQEFKVSLRSRETCRCGKDRKLLWRWRPCTCGRMYDAGKCIRCGKQYYIPYGRADLSGEKPVTDGIINVYKERGFTSHDVVAKLRGILKMKKIGHTGTLDPEAEGVLPVCLGKATKVCELLTDKEKTYQAVLLLGTVTDTQDTTGEVLETHPVVCQRREARYM